MRHETCRVCFCSDSCCDYGCDWHWGFGCDWDLQQNITITHSITQHICNIVHHHNHSITQHICNIVQSSQTLKASERQILTSDIQMSHSLWLNWQQSTPFQGTLSWHHTESQRKSTCTQSCVFPFCQGCMGCHIHMVSMSGKLHAFSVPSTGAVEHTSTVTSPRAQNNRFGRWFHLNQWDRANEIPVELDLWPSVKLLEALLALHACW